MDAAALGAKTACGVMVFEGLIAPVPNGLSGVACAQLCDPDAAGNEEPEAKFPDMFPPEFPDMLPMFTEVLFAILLLLGMLP